MKNINMKQQFCCCTPQSTITMALTHLTLPMATRASNQEQNNADVSKSPILTPMLRKLDKDKLEALEGSLVAVTTVTNQSMMMPEHPNIVDFGVKPSPRECNLQYIAQFEDKFDSGYDSDGELGPFNYMLNLEGTQDFDEDAMSELENFVSEMVEDDNNPPSPTANTAGNEYSTSKEQEESKEGEAKEDEQAEDP